MAPTKISEHVVPDATETTALLAEQGDNPPRELEAGSRPDDVEDKPLDKKQIFFLCLARAVEPIAFFCIFPFINQMIYDTGEIAKTDVGFYSGLIESLFSLTQMLVMIPWGVSSDTFGRKPVLVLSLAGVAVGTAAFGLSHKIYQMIILRCFSGIFAGTIVTIRTMISENSSPKTEARAFSLFAFTGNLGIFIGPFLGGALADPVKNYPKVFGRAKFFKEFPYALPTFVTGSLGAIACITSAIFIKETLVKKPSGASTTRKLSTWELLGSPNVPAVLFVYGHVMVLAFAYTAVVPVFWFTPIELGGFGFRPLLISIFMGVGGLSQSIWLLVAFPWLQARIGTKGVMKLCGTAYPFFFVVLPMCNVLLRYNFTTLFWCIAPATLVVGSGVSMSFTAIQLALNDVAPSPQVLGTLNAASLTLVSGLRAICPALFASLFATGVRLGWAFGQLCWIVLIGFAVAFAVSVRFLPEKRKQPANPESSGPEDGQS